MGYHSMVFNKNYLQFTLDVVLDGSENKYKQIITNLILIQDHGQVHNHKFPSLPSWAK